MPGYNTTTKTFNLLQGTKTKAVLAAGRHFTIEQLFIYCKKRTKLDMYIDRYAGYSDTNGQVWTKFYIYKDEELHQGIQYNRLLAYYDAKNRAWVEQSEHKPLVFNFTTPCKLVVEIDDTDATGEIDIICNLVKNK